MDSMTWLLSVSPGWTLAEIRLTLFVTQSLGLMSITGTLLPNKL